MKKQRHYLIFAAKTLHPHIVTRLGDLFNFGQLFKACGNN